MPLERCSVGALHTPTNEVTTISSGSGHWRVAQLLVFTRKKTSTGSGSLCRHESGGTPIVGRLVVTMVTCAWRDTAGALG